VQREGGREAGRGGRNSRSGIRDNSRLILGHSPCDKPFVTSRNGESHFRRSIAAIRERADNPISDIASIFNALEIHPLRDAPAAAADRIATVDRGLANSPSDRAI